jgi:hypothetical protein
VEPEPAVAPNNPKDTKVQQVGSTQTSPQTTPPPPARNCQVTITNLSRSAIIHLYLNGKGTSNLRGCGIDKGQTVTVCLPVGQHTLYVFSNMYQFSEGMTINVPANDSYSLSLRSGP